MVPVRTATASVLAAMPVLAVRALTAVAHVATVMHRARAIHLAMARSGAANAVMLMAMPHAMDMRHVMAKRRAAAKAAAGTRRNRGAIGPATASSPRVLVAIVRRTAPMVMVPVGAVVAKVPPVTSRARIATPAAVLLMASPLARGPALAARRTPSPASAAATARAVGAQPGKMGSLGACVRAGVGSVNQHL